MEPVTRTDSVASVPSPTCDKVSITDWIESAVAEVVKNKSTKIVTLQTIASHPRGLTLHQVFELVQKVCDQLKGAELDALLPEVIRGLEESAWVNKLDHQNIPKVNHPKARLEFVRLLAKNNSPALEYALYKLPITDRPEVLLVLAKTNPKKCLELTLGQHLPIESRRLIARELYKSDPKVLCHHLGALGIRKEERKDFPNVPGFMPMTVREFLQALRHTSPDLEDRLDQPVHTALSIEEKGELLKRGARHDQVEMDILVRAAFPDSKDHLPFIMECTEDNPNSVIKYLREDFGGTVANDDKEKLVTNCFRYVGPHVALEGIDLSPAFLDRLATSLMRSQSWYLAKNIKDFCLPPERRVEIALYIAKNQVSQLKDTIDAFEISSEDIRSTLAVYGKSLPFNDYLVFLSKLKLRERDVVEAIELRLKDSVLIFDDTTFSLLRDLIKDKALCFQIALKLAESGGSRHFLESIDQFSPTKEQLLSIIRSKSPNLNLEFAIPHLKLFDFDKEEERFECALNFLKMSEAGSKFPASYFKLDHFKLTDAKKKELFDQLLVWNPEFVFANIGEFISDAVERREFGRKALNNPNNWVRVAMNIKMFDLTEEERYTVAERMVKQNPNWLTNNLTSFSLSIVHKEAIIDPLLREFCIEVAYYTDLSGLSDAFQLKILDQVLKSGVNFGFSRIFKFTEEGLLTAARKLGARYPLQVADLLEGTSISEEAKESIFVECFKIHPKICEKWRDFHFKNPPTVEYAKGKRAPVDQVMTEPSKLFRFKEEQSLVNFISNPKYQPHLNALLDAMENCRDSELLNALTDILHAKATLGLDIEHLKNVDANFIIPIFLLKDDVFIKFIQKPEFKDFFKDGVKVKKLLKFLTAIYSPYDDKDKLVLKQLQAFIEKNAKTNRERVKLLESACLDLRALHMLRAIDEFTSPLDLPNPRDLLIKKFTTLVKIEPTEITRLLDAPRNFGFYCMAYTAALSTLPQRKPSLEAFTQFLQSTLNETFKATHFSEVGDLQAQKVFSLLKDKTPWMRATKAPLVDDAGAKVLTRETLIEILRQKKKDGHLGTGLYPRFEKALENPDLLDAQMKALEEERAPTTYEELLLKLLKFDNAEKVLGDLQDLTPKDNAFRTDIELLLKLLKPEVSSKKLWIGLSTEPKDYFLCGQEVSGSCQAVTGNPEYNRGLIGYLMNATTALVAVTNEKEELEARCILRLYTNEAQNKVYLLQETTYSNIRSDAITRALTHEAARLAQELGVEHVVADKSGDLTAISVGGKGPEYSDAAGGVQDKDYSFNARIVQPGGP